MSSQGGFGIPGFGAAAYTVEREIIWGGSDLQVGIMRRNSIVSGAARDAGNSPTTLLRRGLLLGRVDSSGALKEWVATNTDGTQNINSILNISLKSQDFDATNADRSFGTVVKAPLIASQLLIQGAALVGHADEYIARKQLVSMGCVLDDDMQGFLGGLGARYATVTETSDTLTAAENNTRLFYSNAAAVAVTLPALKAGLVYEIVRTGDEEIVVSSAETGNMIVGNDLSANSITFTTAGNHIGAIVRVEGVYVGSTLKWLVTLPPAPFGTGTATLAYSIAT